MKLSGFAKLMAKNVPHIHEKILLSLDYDTFKNSKGVCEAWDELLESETFMEKANSVFCGDMEKELLRYSREGDADKVKSLLSKGVDPNCKEMGITPLVWAAKLGHKNVVQTLLYHGADPNMAKDVDRMLKRNATEVRKSLRKYGI